MTCSSATVAAAAAIATTFVAIAAELFAASVAEIVAFEAVVGAQLAVAGGYHYWHAAAVRIEAFEEVAGVQTSSTSDRQWSPRQSAVVAAAMAGEHLWRLMMLGAT